jgi:xanthine dehydrogenase accessory factor
MQGSQLDVLHGCLHALNRGHKVTLVSVAKTWGTSPRPVGSLFAVTSHGQFYGSVSGGCVEEAL